jgi:hypothetical protein
LLLAPTLVIAVKPNCDGCHDFIFSELSEFEGLTVVIVTANDEVESEWEKAPRPIYTSPELFAALDIRSPPFYVLLQPDPSLVVGEGIAFSPTQVASEIAGVIS